MSFIFQERLSDSPFVELIWQTRSAQAASPFTSIAVSQWEMVITRQKGIMTFGIRGPETQATLAPVPEDAEIMGITFKLGTYMPYLPAKMLVDNGIVLPQANSKSIWLQGAAWQIPDFENADTFVNWLVRDGLLMRESAIDEALQGYSPALSVRALQYRFLHTTGLTQKTIQQIRRARQAAALLERGVPILDTVYQTGYFDQSHLTRSLKRYIGQTPTQIGVDQLVGVGDFY